MGIGSNIDTVRDSISSENNMICPRKECISNDSMCLQRIAGPCSGMFLHHHLDIGEYKNLRPVSHAQMQIYRS